MQFTDVVRRATLALAALALPGFLVASAAAAAASPVAATGLAATTTIAATHVAAVTQTGKPVPVRPPSSPGAGTGAAIPAKPGGHRTDRPLTAWTVSLTASSNDLWPTQYSTLTATTNMNVGPTPYYLRIYDETAGAYVVTCATGTTCSSSVTQPLPTTHYYVAVVSYASTGYPPAGVQASYGAVGVLWHGANVTLAASQPTVPVGGVSTLTATTSQDIGPSPFWTEIFDMTTGTRVMDCGSGTTCSVSVSEAAATTHEYVAYLSDLSTAYPPPGLQETSPVSFITWSNLGWQVSLSAPVYTYGSETVTATVNGNVGPTPYYIEIYNENGTRLTACGAGSTCSVAFTPSYAGSHLVAFVSPYGTALPPSGAVASSNVVTSYLEIIP
ncbi:MAG: hypothetical protein ABSB76_22995 [Streptosporangiaceae bacterium]|jgi:hypothetical protein